MLFLGTFYISVQSVQNAFSLSLNDIFDKLFGGLFQKPTDNQSKYVVEPTNKQIQKQQQLPPFLSNKNYSSSIPNLAVSNYSISSSTTSVTPSVCHIVNGSLPDPKCTPGSINPNVKQKNIKNTICVSGFSKNIRPPVSYTNPLKVKLMHSYGFTDSRSNYELDHLIPLSIGGSPKSVTNLWPEPGYGQYDYHIKDRYENYLHRAVCSGKISLEEAQKDIAYNWLVGWKKAGQP